MLGFSKSIQKYHRVVRESIEHHTLGLFGPLLGAHANRASCVCTMAIYKGQYQKGVKTLCSLEQGDWSLLELEGIMYEHAGHLGTDYFWVPDMPALKFVRSQKSFQKKLRAVALGADSVDDDGIRQAVAAIETQIDSGRVVLPSASDKMHPETAGFAADLKSFDPANLRSVTLRVLAVAVCSVACDRRVKAGQLVHFYDARGRKVICTPEQAWRMYDAGIRPGQYGSKPSAQSSVPEAYARQLGAMLSLDPSFRESK